MTVRRGVAVILALLSGAIARGQSAAEIPARLEQIADARRIAVDPQVALDDRRAAAQRAVDDWIALAVDHPDAPDAPTWRLNAASDAFFLLLPFDAAELAVQFGRPTPAQSALIDEVVTIMRAQVDAAAPGLVTRIDTLEARLRAGDGGERERRRRTDLVNERDGRLVLLRGLRRYLNAAFVMGRDAPGRARLYEDAVRDLNEAARRFDGAAGRAAQLRAGHALAELGRFDEAETRFRTIATDPDAPARDVLAARLGGVRNRVIRGGPGAGLTAIASVRDRYRRDAGAAILLLLADTEHRLLAASGLPATECIAPYVALLSEPDDTTRDALRGVATTRILEAVPPDAPTDALPAIVRILEAERMARDPVRRGAALAILRELLGDRQMKASDRAAALQTLGDVAQMAGGLEEAADAWERLAREFSTRPRAIPAIQDAARLRLRLYRDDPTPARRDAAASVLLRLVRQFPLMPNVDAWRLTAGDFFAAIGDSRAAIEALEGLDPASPEWTASLPVIANLMQRETRALPAGFERERDQRLLLAWVRAALRRLDERPPDDAAAIARAQLLIVRAETHLDLDEDRSAAEALALIDEPGPPLPAEWIGRRRRAAYRTLVLADRFEDANETLRRLLNEAPGEGVTVIGDLVGDLGTALNDPTTSAARADALAEALDPLVRLLEERLPPTSADESIVAIRLRIGDACLAARSFDRARRSYEAVLSVRPNLASALLGRAECQWALDIELDDAMRTYRRLANATSDVRGEIFWRSQLRMLEILDRLKRNVDQIAPRINRLQKLDPTLGGPAFRPRFEQLRRTHAP